MNWPDSVKALKNGWRMQDSKLIAPDGEEYGPMDALTPKQVAQLRNIELHTVTFRLSTGGLPSFGFEHPLIYAKDAVRQYQARKVDDWA